MLKTEHLCFAYADGREVIHDLSLAFAAGEITALVGKNGSGKTTLTRLLMGLERPTSGSIELNGRELTRLSASERSRFLGYVFQQADRQLFCTTVYDEIAFGPLEQGRDKVETRAKAEAALKLCGLEEERDAYPPLLSRAKKQRVALASAVALGAEFLILDEPTSGISPADIRQLMQILTKLTAAGLGIILVTHAPDVVRRYAQRVVMLADGRVVYNGEPQTFLASMYRDGRDVSHHTDDGGAK